MPKHPKAPQQNHELVPRRAALEILTLVLEQGRMIDEAYEEVCARFQINDPRDRGLVRMLSTTAVRRLGQLDYAIRRFLKKKLPAKARRIQHILRIGATQIMFLEIPAHAAVDTSVSLAGKDRHPAIRAYKSLVNAVLRRIAENRDEILTDQNAPDLCVPKWLRTAWQSCYGSETALKIAEASLIEAALDISLKPELDVQLWAEKLGAEKLETGSLRLQNAGRIEQLPGFSDGAWWIQDAAAALPARLLGAAAGDRVLDLCAAPGGKTAQLAAAGCKVTAVDQSASRLERLTENLARLQLEAEVITSDAAAYSTSSPYPFILLDAPCTTTGTLRRHPDVMHHKSPAEVRKMADIQTRLLNAALGMLLPGGTLLYCVCSLQAEEGPDQINALLAAHPELARKPVSGDEIPGIEAFITPEGDVRTLPYQMGGMDGFFVSRLQAVANL